MLASGHGGIAAIVEAALKMARKVTSGPFPDEGYCDITIPAHGRHTLEFDGAEYFESGPLGAKASFIWSFMLSVVAGV